LIFILKDVHGCFKWIQPKSKARKFRSWKPVLDARGKSVIWADRDGFLRLKWCYAYHQNESLEVSHLPENETFGIDPFKKAAILLHNFIF